MTRALKKALRVVLNRIMMLKKNTTTITPKIILITAKVMIWTTSEVEAGMKVEVMPQLLLLPSAAKY